MNADKIIIFDTTLRDGEQAAGSRLGAKEKLAIAHQLARLNVDVMEVGFPISSPEDFGAVQLISREVKGPIIAGLSRAVAADIDACGNALSKAERPRIHTFIGTSPSHRAMMKKSPGQVLDMAIAAVERAKSFCPDVEFSPMDATRTEFAYLCEVVEAAIASGATTINVPDTVGYAFPGEFGDLIRELRHRVPNVSEAVISVHCHNDLGMATANSLAAVENGAGQVECTINGVGERAGNAALEEVVMMLRTRRDHFRVHTDIKAREFSRTSHLVAELLGMAIPPNKAVVGSSAFAHSSGIHQDGVLKERGTFEIMSPEDVGFAASRIVLTARSGRHALRHRLEEMGYVLSPEELDKTYSRFLLVADKKQEVFDEDLAAIVRDEIHPIPETYHLEYLHTSSGTGTIPTATVRIRTGNKTVQEAACGDGPVDATYLAIQAGIAVEVTVSDYSIRAVTGGASAMGEVTIRLEGEGESVVGRGASTDIIEASAKAYIDGLNKLAARRK
ncbi:MAG: 2-isopropylmalate synthase [Candidatus Latescibacterota bacterium]